MYVRNIILSNNISILHILREVIKMIYIKDIIANHPIRRSEEQKEKFRKYICEETKNINKEIKVECLDKKHNNILKSLDFASLIVIGAYYLIFT